MTITTLRFISDSHSSDFGEGEFGRQISTKLLRTQKSGGVVRILREATDGYYDIELPDGTQVDAISWYHLVGYHKP